VREKILDCAFGILARHGYEGLSLSKIGKKMRMTAANLYNYYGNKDELLIAIHKKSFGMLYDSLQGAVREADSPRNKFKCLINTFVGFGIKNVHLYDIMFTRPIKQYTDYIGTPQEEMSRDEYMSSLRVLELAFNVFQDYCRVRPELRGADAKNMVIQGMVALHGIISLYNSGILATVAENPEEVVKSFVNDTIEFSYRLQPA
jgi:AcrR family transcriptional regulator